MCKAEEKALKKYPVRSVLIVPARGGWYYADSHLREGFIEGYRQAEKDLELNVEDVKLICEIEFSIVRSENELPSEEAFYKEILERYKNLKK